MKSFIQRNEDALESRKWILVDAEGVPVGRLASEVASIIRGKNKVTFTPHVDGGDFVVVINAEKVKFTGNKLETKVYYDHTTYIGGLKTRTAKEMLESKPEQVIKRAVEGMLPSGPLGFGMATKLKIYVGSEHPHAAQKPVLHKLKSQRKESKS